MLHNFIYSALIGGAQSVCKTDLSRTDVPCLVKAAKDGDLGKVSNLLNKKEPVNVQDDFGNTPLMLAAENDHLDVVTRLLAANPKLDIQNQAKKTALMMASFTTDGHEKVV